MIVIRNLLDEKEKQEVNHLVKECLIYDGLERDLSLENDNLYEELNCFFLYYEGTVLASVLTIYQPSAHEAEVFGYTLPSYRRRGYFLELLERAEEELWEFQIPEILLAAEPASKEAKYIAALCEADYKKSEYLLHLDVNTAKPMTGSSENIVIRKTLKEDLEHAILLSETIFHTGHDFEEELLREAITDSHMDSYTDSHMDSYLAYMGNTLIGICNIQYTGEDAFIFGIGILPKFQGQGYGRELLLEVLYTMREKGIKSICLSVGSENKKAYGLYKSVGFRVKTQYDYYSYLIE